jgi:HK97 family phage major capsid protein
MPQRTLGDIKAEQTQVRTRVGNLVDEAREIEIKLDVDGADAGLEERKANIERGKAKASARLQELGDEYRSEMGRRVANGTLSTESEQDPINDRARPPESETRVQTEQVDPHRRAALDGALRTLERCQSRDTMSARAAVAVEGVVRHADPSGTTGRYIAAVGADDYNSAFGKLLKYGDTAAMRMTQQEQAAMQRVSQVESERAMIDGTGSSGGFAIPIEIDPTILLTSSGALNPVRSVADVRQMSSLTLRLLSADTPASTYAAELTEATDGSPTLVQPTLTAARGQSFIPFSIEIEQDWTGIQQQLLRLLADGKDILDATKFLTGSGSNEPQGLFSGAGGLQTAQRIQTAITGTFGIGDGYALREGIAPTRFFANAVFAAHPTTWDSLYRTVGGGNTTEPQPFTQGRGGAFVGTPKIEWSTMGRAPRPARRSSSSATSRGS